MNKAIFLDRDGTIIEDPGYLSEAEQIRIFDGVPEQLKKLKDNGFLLFIITNQSGIARGFFSEPTLLNIHDKLSKLFGTFGVKFDGIAYCPHLPEDCCECRKPNPLMVREFVKKFDIDLKSSYFVGDKMSDVVTGQNVGCKTVLIVHDKTLEQIYASRENTALPDLVAKTPEESLKLVLQDIQKV